MAEVFGSDAHVHRVVEQWSPLLLRLSYSYLGSTADAEDVVQEVFLALLERGKPFKDTEHEKAWLIKVTVNKCKNCLKAAWRSRRSPMPAEAAAPAPEEPLGVLEAVMALPPLYRIPIHLHYCEGWSTGEIAAMLGVSPVTARTRLHRGRAMLRDVLEGGNE